MHRSSSLRRSLLAVMLALCAGAVPAREPAASSPAYQPSVGQAGKDVIWVPTARSLVDKMLDAAAVTPRDFVVDLGSGDGRTVIAAAKRGARALGIEFNPDMVELSKRKAREEGVAQLATFVRGDIFESDFSQATVVTLFLLPDLNIRLRPRLLEMRPGTRVVSNSFDMGEWKADQTLRAEESEDCRSYCVAYLWIVPARVAGTWRMPQGELVLTQEFQMLGGQLRLGDKTMPITDGLVRGDRLSFKVNGVEHTGRIEGDRIEGSIASDGKWTARRTVTAGAAASAGAPAQRDAERR